MLRISSIPFAALILFTIVAACVPAVVQAGQDELTRYTLPNGLQVLFKEDHARKVATIQLWVMVGSADEAPSQRGISHLIEHMAFKGTQRRGVGDVAREVEALGGDTNAYTSLDKTVFHVTVPSDSVVQGLDILTDAVLSPSIDPEELEKEKQVVLEEILEGEERPAKKLYKLLFETAYTQSPYRYPIIGFKETVEKFSREDIVEFRKQWYGPQNMFLLVVGDVNPQALLPEIERMTSGLKPSVFVRSAHATEPPQEAIRGATVRDGNAQETRLSIGFHIPSIRSGDVNAIDLAADILGGRESARLVRVVKREKQLVTSIAAYSYTPKDPGLFVVTATLDAKNIEAATQAIMDEIRKLATSPPSDEELQRAKTSVESDYVYSRETVGGIARVVGGFESDRGDASYESVYLTANSAVTPEQVSKATAKYLAPPNVTVAVLMPEKDSPDFRTEQLVRLITEYRPETSSAAARATDSDQVVTRTLSNGMRLVLMPDRSNPVTSVRIASLGGKRFETKDTAGIMNFVSRIVTKGTESMTENDVTQRVADMGGRLEGFSGYDSFGLNGSFFARHLPEGLGLMAALYTKPSFAQDVVERERKLILNRIKTAPDRPVEFAINKLNEALFGGHPYGFDKDGTATTVGAFTRDDLLKTYQRYAVPTNTVITLVGDFDAPEVEKLVEKLFGGIPASPFEAPTAVKQEAPIQVKERIVRIPRAKAHLVIGFLGSTMKDEDRYALEVLNNVLNGQGGRLFLDLRDKKSLAYSVASLFRPALDRGLFGFYIASDPSKSDEAYTGLIAEIKLAAKTPPSEDELKRAKHNLLGNHKINLQSSWSRAENVGLNTLYGLGHDYDPEYVRKISQVTAQQVHDVAKKYLDPDKATAVKIIPE